MKRYLIALAALAALGASPTLASAQSLDESLARSGGSFALVDASGIVVGHLVANSNGTLTLAKTVARTTVLAPERAKTFVVDYSKALTPQQFDDAYRAAHDAFFDVSHAP